MNLCLTLPFSPGTMFTAPNHFCGVGQTFIVMDPTWMLMSVLLHALADGTILVACLTAVRRPVLRREFACFTAAALLRILQELAFGSAWIFKNMDLGWAAELDLLILPLFCVGFILLAFRLKSQSSFGGMAMGFSGVAAIFGWSSQAELWLERWEQPVCMALILGACVFSARYPFFRRAFVILGLGALVVLTGDLIFQWHSSTTGYQLTLESFPVMSVMYLLQELGLVLFAVGAVLLAKRVNRLSAVSSTLS